MANASAVLTEEPALADFTAGVRRNVAVTWYRTPVLPAELKTLHLRSDLKGAGQTLGYLGILVATGGLALYSFGHFAWYVTLALVFLHGMAMAFSINAVHELGHGTVFKTKGLNVFFCHLFAFPGWNNHEMFQASHTRHHRYTLHPPDDLEVTLDRRMVLWHLLRDGVVNLPGAIGNLKYIWRIARGRFEGEWELTLFPASAPEKRRAPVRWARILLGGHATILGVSLAMGWWLVPVVVSLTPFYGGWLFFLCNNTQHVGLQDNVTDFRLCCRTFTLNPVVRFLYWQMNYHTEHHMYAAIPCYHLGRLHQLIRHELPVTQHGLWAVWREIGGILAQQKKDPTYQKVVELPSTTSADNP
jgi:fatty acid desaturase